MALPDIVQLNLPPTLPGYTRCGNPKCLREMARTSANKLYCTRRCKLQCERDRRKLRETDTLREMDVERATMLHPGLRAKANLTNEQVLAYCPAARANPNDMIEFAGKVPEGLELPPGFSATQGPEAWLLRYDAAEAGEAQVPRELTEMEKIQAEGNARIAKMLEGL